MAQAAKKKWRGTYTKCDICHKEPKKWFVDGRTKMGPWALMCQTCHPRMGVGIGPGCGQKYDASTLEKLEG